MALVGKDLGAAIKAAIDAVPDASNRDAVFQAMGEAIVAYLIANTQVVVASVGGVTTGTASSGPGTGTIV